MIVGRAPRPVPSRRGFVLLTVVILIGASMLVAVSVISNARAEHAGRVANFDAVRRRAAAWSAAQAIASLLGEQRPAVLTGGAPTLRDQLPLYDDGVNAVTARLLSASGDGELVLAEASLLDANTASTDAMALVGFDESVAEFIIAARERAPGGRLASLEEIVDQDGCDPTLLRGAEAFDATALAVLKGARGDEQGSALARAGEALRGAGRSRNGSALQQSDMMSSEDGVTRAESGSTPNAGASGPALADRLTVFAVEPSLTREGKRRIELDGTWSESLRSMLGGAVTPDVAKRLESLASQRAAIDNDAVLVESLIALGIEPSGWAEVLDRLTAERGIWRQGRIDINRAPGEVLATLPGLNGEQVARLVRERESLDVSERASPTWIVARGIVEPAAFAQLVPRVTTRSFFWRVRFAAGFSALDNPDGPLHGATIWECVIDLTGERARIASLRDLTMAPVAARLVEVRSRMLDPDTDKGRDAEESSERGAALAHAGSRLRDAGSTKRAQEDQPRTSPEDAPSSFANDADRAPAQGAPKEAARESPESADSADAPKAKAPRTRAPRGDGSPPRRRGGNGSAAPAGAKQQRARADGAPAATQGPPPSPGPVGRFRVRPGTAVPGGSDADGAMRSSPTDDDSDPLDPVDDDLK